MDGWCRTRLGYWRECIRVCALDGVQHSLSSHEACAFVCDPDSVCERWTVSSEGDFERFQELRANDLFFELMTNNLPSLAHQVMDMAGFQVNPSGLTEDGNRLLRPVMLAFAKGYYEVMEKLVEKGARLTVTHGDNVKLLYILTLDGQWELSQELLAQEPNLVKECVNVRDPNTGRLLFEIILQHRTPDVPLELLSKLAPTDEKVIANMEPCSRLMVHLVRREIEAADAYFYNQQVDAIYKKEHAGWNHASEATRLAFVSTIRRGLLHVVKQVYETLAKKKDCCQNVFSDVIFDFYSAGQYQNVEMYKWMLETAKNHHDRTDQCYKFHDILSGVASVSWDTGYEIGMQYVPEDQRSSADYHKLLLGAKYGGVKWVKDCMERGHYMLDGKDLRRDALEGAAVNGHFERFKYLFDSKSSAMAPDDLLNYIFNYRFKRPKDSLQMLSHVMKHFNIGYGQYADFFVAMDAQEYEVAYDLNRVICHVARYNASSLMRWIQLLLERPIDNEFWKTMTGVFQCVSSQDAKQVFQALEDKGVELEQSRLNDLLENVVLWNPDVGVTALLLDKGADLMRYRYGNAPMVVLAADKKHYQQLGPLLQVAARRGESLWSSVLTALEKGRHLEDPVVRRIVEEARDWMVEVDGAVD